MNDVSRDGPKPKPTLLERADQGFPSEAVFCSEQGGTVKIFGTGFSPMPRDVLAGSPGIELPEIVLIGGSANLILDGVVYDRESGTLTADIPAGLTAGSYTLRVENPNGNAGAIESAVQIVPPPQLSAIEPTSGMNSETTPVALTGVSFRAAADGTQPAVTFTPVGGGTGTPISNSRLASSTQVDADVQPGIAAGFYDVTITNPEGCSATLPNAFEVIQPLPIDLCTTVNPGFGWVNARTTVEICAFNDDGNGLLSTPEAFILIGGEEIPLRREAFIDAGTTSTKSVMTAVIPSAVDDARIAVGGPYDLRVINPNGAMGVITGAFQVLADPPPRIGAINPGRGDKGTVAQITIQGADFKDAMQGDSVTPVLSVTLLAANGAEHACPVTAVSLDTPQAGIDSVTCSMTLPGVTGGYVVRVRHEDDHSFDLFATFAVTESSRKLAQTTTPQSQLNAKRRSHAATLGLDDLENRWLYAIGGEDETGAVLASGEVAGMSDFGQLGQWTTLPNPLPAARTGLALVRYGRWVYVIGGSPDKSAPYDPTATGTAQEGPTVLRARILGSDTAPRLSTPTASDDGALDAGTYYYRVSAVMAASGDNPGGETLASDVESIRVSATGKVTLTWALPEGVSSGADIAHYRVYRSPLPDATSNAAALLADNVAALTYVDDGSATPDEQVVPFQPGSLGKWVTMPDLVTPRFDAAATVVEIDPTHIYLYVAGGRAGPANGDVLNTLEYIAIDPANGNLTGTWTQSASTFSKRAEHVLVPVTHALAETVPEGVFAVAVAGGTPNARGTGGAVSSIEVSVLDADVGGASPGAPGAWSATGPTGNRVGLTGIVVNDFFYAFNGWSGTGNSFASASEKSGTTACSGAPPCTPTFTGFSSATVSFDDGHGTNTAAFRSTLVFFGAYFYFVGGSSGLNQNTTSNAVIRGTY